MPRPTDPVGHWEDLEIWLSAVTDSLLPKAAEAVKQQTQDQLDNNITGIMKHDPGQSYGHKELAKITGSLSHTLIASLKRSDRRFAYLQQELKRAQQRIEQLELEDQDQREGSNETDPRATEEIARLQETLANNTQEMEQAKSARAELSGELQYVEQLLEKARLDFRDKNSRIKALETHLNEARTEISYLTQQLEDMKEELDSVKNELRHAYELRPEPTRTQRAPPSPLPSRPGSHVPETSQNVTFTLAPDLHKETTAGMDHADDNTHLNATGKNPGTIQDLVRIGGRDHGASQPHQEAQEMARGNLMQPVQQIDERTYKDPTLIKLKLNLHMKKRHCRVLIHKN
ncbi:uncharacterized protein [Garra rufa]|uniref:uncharacterized protein n=1 Tax=Garra rufa TaxID=137080 RepID=UPI003CCE6BA8